MTSEQTSSHISNITSTYVVLGDNGDAIPIAVNHRFYEDLEQKFDDFKGKRLISHYNFEESWNSWEMHPAGEEFVCLLSGQVDFILEQNGTKNSVSLNAPGDYVLVRAESGILSKFIHSALCYLLRPVRERSIAPYSNQS